MKVPDKIYIKEYPQGLNQMWSSIMASETSANTQHEYIRKDALLEWAEAELERLYALIPDASKVEDGTATQMEMRFLGQYMQMESIIDKIKFL